jgi:hypothetical protein
MSARPEVSVLGFRNWTTTSSLRGRAADRPLVRLATFAALALWGTSRWATLISPAPQGRLFGVCALAIAVAGVGSGVARGRRVLLPLLALLGAAAMLAAAGIPVEWIRHARISVAADAIGQGLSALPNVLVPYLGINPWVHVVIVLGAAVLLLDAALLAGLAPGPRRDLRRAAAALPLVALAIVPATIVRPGFPYVQGIVLFALLVAFMWADRAPAGEPSTIVSVVALVAVIGLIAGPRIDPHTAWIDPSSLAGSLSIKNVDRFDWAQRYGPLVWPRNERTVLDVKAAHADYWKAENLDVFDSRGWVQMGTGFSGGQVPQPSAATRKKWTQSLQVTIEAMKTTTVIAAGAASKPAHVPEGVAEGISPGTWTAGALLGPGASYTVKTYSPHPSAGQLASAGSAYPAAALAGDMSMELPRTPATIGNAPEVTFAPFHAARAVSILIPGTAGEDATQMLQDSPYARTYALARRLASGAPTPYAFVQSVMNYLSHGFSYDEHPPAARYPLVSFLFDTRHGYCQQFAGSMALLLRMGGIPARVAAGFTPGVLNKATGEYEVSDFDAHAWVEAWFPKYGWVRFDPTPAIAPARGGKTGSLTKGAASSDTGAASNRTHDITGALGSARVATHRGGGSSDTLWIVLGAVLGAGLFAIVLAALLSSRAGERSGDQLLSELERALRRSGRPIGDGVTLAAIEHRFRGSTAAQAYVRAIRLRRFGAASAAPSGSQRRAVRAQLAHGLGPIARLRALWALPPRLGFRPR